MSDMAIARFWQRVCYVCIGALASFCHQGPSHPWSPVPGLGPQGLSAGRRRSGLSAGDLLQGPQGRLQGHVHSVADGFGVVWHRLTSALEGRGRWAFLLKNSSGAPGSLRNPAPPLWAPPGYCCSCLRHPMHRLAIWGLRLSGPPAFRILAIAHLGVPHPGRERAVC